MERQVLWKYWPCFGDEIHLLESWTVKRAMKAELRHWMVETVKRIEDCVLLGLLLALGFDVNEKLWMCFGFGT